MKELFNKFVKMSHSIIVDDANLATTASAVYDTLGRRDNNVTFERVWALNGQQWLVRFNASGAQWEEITMKLGRK